MEGASTPPSPARSSLLLHNCSPIPAKTRFRNLYQPFPIRRIKIISSTISPQRQTRTPSNGTKNLRPSSLSLITKNHEPFTRSDAFPSSTPLREKNPHAIYRDIQSMARGDNLKGALAILDYLEKQGIPVNPTTFSSLIASCIRSKSLILAENIHRHIRLNGLENNEFLRTKIVQMYASCGSTEDAKSVFDGAPKNTSSNNVYSWNALLRGSVVSGGRRYGDVFDYYYRMRESGVELNEYSFSCLIKSFAGAVAFRQGLKIHGLLIKNGYIGSSLLRTTLIDMYFKCRKIKLAWHVFDEMSERDVVVWGAMIAGFAHNGLPKEALRYFRRLKQAGIEPNSVVLSSIIPVIGELGAKKAGKEVHGYVIKRSYYKNQAFIHSALIDMYCKCGDMSSGRKVFSSLDARNTISWTALISGYIRNGRLDQALKSVVWMQQEGRRPDVVTVATVLPVCAKLGALRQGKELHAYVARNAMLPNVSLITSLIVMYSKCAILEYACRLFDGMERRNVISWTAMIDSFAENGCLHEALDAFRSMQLSKHRPDFIAVSRILSVCSDLRVLKLGKEVHAQVFKKDLESIPLVAAETMKMYGKCGEVNKAKLAFDLIQIQGSLTQSAMIEVFGCNGHFREAMIMFDEMVANACNPSHATFSIVLSICEQAGFGDEARRVFKLMTQRLKLEASKEHYDPMIRLLIRLGRVQEAEEYIQRRASMAS